MYFSSERRSAILSKLLVIGVATFLLLVVAAKAVHTQQSDGQTGNGFRIAPVRSELVIERGQEDSVEVTVTNVTELPINVDLGIFDFRVDENGTATPIVVADGSIDSAYSIQPFIQQLDDIVLGPGETRSINVVIAIPEDVSPGSYFGILRALRLADDEVEGGPNVGISASVGSIILVTVPGDTVELVSLDSVEVLKDGRPGSFFEKAPDSVAVGLRNEGNVFAKPFGKVSVTNWKGDTVYDYEINNSNPRGNVLPESTRVFTDKISNISSFGKYTVQTNISYGGGGSILTATASFWVVPWKVVLTGAFIVIAVSLLLFRGIKAYNRMILDRNKGQRVKKG